MEHKDENDYLSAFLNDESQGDFDNLLKEKMKGWTNPSEQELLDSLKSTKTKHKLPPADDVVESSLATSKSNETDEPVSSDESIVALPAVEVSSNGGGDDKPPVVVAPAGGGNGDDGGDDNNDPPHSDPEFTRQIIEGKVPQHGIRGIKQGPWANETLKTKVLPEQETLESLGFVNIADIFGNARKFYVRKYGSDPMAVIGHINRLEGALVIVRHMRDDGLKYVEELLKGRSEEEIKKAKDALSKTYRTKAAKTRPDGAGVKERKPRAVKSDKPKEPPLDKEVKSGYKTLIAMGVTYDTLLQQIADKKPIDAAQRIMWLRWKFGKE
jgi:hypothetical protein